MNMRRLVLYTLASALLTGCASQSLMRQPPVAEVLQQQATAGPLRVADARVITDNDAAFAAKLKAVDGAKQTLDLAYYIFSDDYSSSRLTQGLIDAAKRGVKVRLLVDYLSAYKELDRFSWLQREGEGRIEVRLYNRPTVEILKDAAFLTLSCADVGVSKAVPEVACDQQKIAAVDQHFDAAVPAGQDRLNLGFAGSSLFLSGLYGKNPQLMAYAVAGGQDIDLKVLAAEAQGGDAARTEQLKNLGKLYFKARFLSGIEGLAARIQLAVIRLAFAEQVNPVFNAINSYLPVTRQKSESAQKDWDYLTEFLHHKFLLADGATLVLGGRNVEDAYHMHAGPLSAKYTFMDTDVRLQLASPDAALPASFDRLWNLHGMVATIEEVRQHAPNDLLENFSVLTAAQDACGQGREQVCVDREVNQHFVPLDRRLAIIGAEHNRRVRRYATDYHPAAEPAPMPIDAGATIHYLENLPVVDGRRVYGVPHDQQAQSNKHIHALWRSALRGVCASADPAPRDVVFHTAYLFMPADLLRDVSAMLDGSRPCPRVTLSLVTNSLATTDLNIVNLLAAWQLKALADHLREKGGQSADAASLRYFEYLPAASGGRSLHSKVMVFDQDIFIGSANADVRSLMMDSNNGVFISNAPRFAGAYHQFLRQILANPSLTADHTALIGRDAQALGIEMNQLIDQLLARYAKERLSDQQRLELKQQIRDTTVKVYDLSRRIMRGDAKAADEFNALFKVI
ncbi:MAG: phospholipase D-like domain-containing protein [Burkholderiales bacterium]